MRSRLNIVLGDCVINDDNSLDKFTTLTSCCLPCYNPGNFAFWTTYISMCPRILKIVVRSLVDMCVAVFQNVLVANITHSHWWAAYMQPPRLSLWPSSVFEHTQLILPLQNEGQLLSHLLNFTCIVKFSLFNLKRTTCILHGNILLWTLCTRRMRKIQSGKSLPRIPTKCT
jgi:hypothetical protein